ncbi:hypothetical protein BKA65DRAFT_555716 [Rhexocercosporidium sp. MPI-PUGE-AT-0058]|nr:hypothetical protein BKA65DRAFT_555716 [Rhexocercosporidium sp. MPI-PUGE-AT-0058]
MSGKTYLITGANRGKCSCHLHQMHLTIQIPGIGRGLFNHYVALPNNTIIAAVRDPSNSQSLHSLPKGTNTNIHVVKIDSFSKTEPYIAINTLRSLGISHIDVVISAVGIAKLNTIEDMPLEEYEEVLMERREAGEVCVYQCGGGSLSEMQKYPYPNASYASSKALANALVVKMGMENEWLITLCIHPGLVQTDMGNLGARAFGLEEAPLTLEDSSKNTAHIIDDATKEGHSEKFFNETIDQIHPW